MDIKYARSIMLNERATVQASLNCFQSKYLEDVLEAFNICIKLMDGLISREPDAVKAVLCEYAPVEELAKYMGYRGEANEKDESPVLAEAGNKSD